jgi:hypothetical protein
MRVFIPALKPDMFPSIREDIFEKMAEYKKIDTYTQVYAENGLFKISPTEIKKYMIFDKPVSKLSKFYKNVDILLDGSVITEEPCFQIEPGHIKKNVKKFIYQLSSSSSAFFVFIEEIIEDVVTIDFYIEFSDEFDIHNILIKQELIGFLSLLI